MENKLTVGGKVYVDDIKKPFVIKAHSGRYYVASRPENLVRSYSYIIFDLHEKLRGPDDRIFGPLYENNTKEGAQKTVNALMTGDLHMSHRRSVIMSAKELSQFEKHNGEQHVHSN